MRLVLVVVLTDKHLVLHSSNMQPIARLRRLHRFESHKDPERCLSLNQSGGFCFLCITLILECI